MTKLWLIPLAALFLALAFYQIDLPGLHYDEAFEVVPAVQLLENQPVSAFRNGAISLFGKSFPLTTQDYIGALNTYGSLPFLALGGISVSSLRAYSVLVGLITLLLVYGFTTALTGQESAGFAAAALLTLNPTFIFWTRQGIFVTAIAAAIGVGAAWSWLGWWRRKDYKLALLGAFLFGLGIYAKLLFVWLIWALFGAFIINEALKGRLGEWRSWLFDLTNGRPGVWAATQRGVWLVLAGAIGCWPLIVYNLQTGGTFKSIGGNAGTSYYGVDNSDVITNLAARFEQLGVLLTGGHLWYLGKVHFNLIMPVVFGLALLTSLWLALKYKKTAALLPFTIIALVILGSIVTVSALWISHFALIMIWPAIGIAAAGVQLARQFSALRPMDNAYKLTDSRGIQSRALGLHQLRFNHYRLVKGGLLVLFAVILITEAKTTWNYHRSLTGSGGLSDHSDAVYDMASWLDENAAGPVIAMDWGLSASTTFLTAGRVTPVEVFGYEWGNTDRFEEIISPHLRPNEALFLWRSPDEVVFDRSGDFKALYSPLNLEEDIQAAFYERSGRPVLGVTSLTPAGEAENKP